MFALATLYAIVAVYVLDRCWPEKSMANQSKVRDQEPHGVP